MNSVCVMMECYEGEEPSLNVYSNLGDAVDEASELASVNGWEKVDGMLRWEEAGAYYNYIEVQVLPVR